MAHFAELDDSNVVIRVIVAGDDETEESVARMFGGRWKQTSYNGRIRGRYAGPGMNYDPRVDEFVEANPQPNL